MRRLWRLFLSVEFCLWLLGGICCALGAGSFLLSGEAAAAIHAMPLLVWLREMPAGSSWWLWLAVVLLLLLALNTLCCSWATLRQKFSRAAILPLVAPQLVHAGFLLVLLAHLASSLWGFNQSLQMVTGMQASLPDGRPFMLGRLTPLLSPSGMPTGASGELYIDPNDIGARVTISPNHPWFAGGYGVYIKHAQLDQQPWALLEIHREPGAGLALAGSLLFAAGIFILLWLRSRAREDLLTGGVT